MFQTHVIQLAYEGLLLDSYFIGPTDFGEHVLWYPCSHLSSCHTNPGTNSILHDQTCGGYLDFDVSWRMAGRRNHVLRQ